MLFDFAKMLSTVSLGQARCQRVDPMLRVDLNQLRLFAPFQLLSTHLMFRILMRHLVVSISLVPQTRYKAAFFVQIVLIARVGVESCDRMLGRAIVHTAISLSGVFP